MTILDYFRNYISMIGFVDVLDMAVVAYAAYKLIMLIRETRAQTLIKGIAILIISLQVSGWAHFNSVNFILRNTMQVGFVALLVVFQPELRHALERMGRGRPSFLQMFNSLPKEREQQIIDMMDQVCIAAVSLSATKTGMLVVIERDTKLSDIIRTGTILDAKVTSELLCNIFFHNAPLHDGAVVIRDNRVHAAACILPLSHQTGISKELGTRHRAGLGMSENSDGIIIIVSEETGKISCAMDGVLVRNLNYDTLFKTLSKVLLPEHKEKDEHWKWPQFKKAAHEPQKDVAAARQVSEHE